MKTNIITIVCLLAVALASSGCITKGHGSHVGYVTASGCDGILSKACNLYLKTDTQSTQEDKYCVDDERGDFDALWGTIQSVQTHKAHVEITYHTELATWFSRCHDGNDIIDSIQVVA